MERSSEVAPSSGFSRKVSVSRSASTSRDYSLTKNIPKSEQSPGRVILPDYSNKSREEAIFGKAGKAQVESEWKVGTRLGHMEFGEGTIIIVSGDVLTVAFAGIGMNKLVASVAPIHPIE